jgi:hypothetical protein
MVASAILMLTVSQATSLFTNSIQATGKAKLRDGLNAAVNADLEQVRHEVANWAMTAAIDGQLSYSPDTTACTNGTLATALLSDRYDDAPPIVSWLDLSGIPTSQGTVQVKRTLSTSNNNNLIAVSYATSASSPISLNINSTLSLPAQGWCP